MAAGGSPSQLKPLVGGDAITLETATDLRKVVYGSTMHSFSSSWRAISIKYQNHGGQFPYGLQIQRNGTRGVLMGIQAHILKHMIFKYETVEDIINNKVLHPSIWERQEALVKGLAEILWRAGEEKEAKVCLMQEKPIFSTDVRYRPDNITEKLRVFTFTSKEDLNLFLKRYMCHFESDLIPGVILFIYSLALSRGLRRIKEDANDSKIQLVTDSEDCSQALVNLLITGQAVSHIHNNELLYDEDGKLLDKPQKGVNQRSEIGFLFWHRDEPERERTQVGSMLKTPKRPVWVSYINGQFGVLYSTRPDLVSDWRVEHQFSLHYYTGLPTVVKPVKLTIDTRFGRRGRGRSARGGRFREEESRKIPALDQCILTKWPGAEINWNGTPPFV